MYQSDFVFQGINELYMSILDGVFFMKEIKMNISQYVTKKTSVFQLMKRRPHNACN